MLSSLILAHGRLVTFDQLTTHLWGSSPPPTASAQIYTYVHRLRKQLGTGVELVHLCGGYRLDLGDATIDLVESEKLTAAGRRAFAAGDHRTAAAKLAAGLALWRGTPLANTTEYMAELERPSLEEAFTIATEQWIAAELVLGHHARLLPELTRLVHRYPLREQFRAQLIVALHHSDRRADALFAYHQGRKMLAEQLGVEPGPGLANAYRTVLRNGTTTAHIGPDRNARRRPAS